jgi:ubiquinone/menaquinone biosynthesis C-methylase UbiE
MIENEISFLKNKKKKGSGKQLKERTAQAINPHIKRACQTWWCMPIIPVIGRLKHEDPEFKSLNYIARHHRKKNKMNRTQENLERIMQNEINQTKKGYLSHDSTYTKYLK